MATKSSTKASTKSATKADTKVITSPVSAVDEQIGALAFDFLISILEKNQVLLKNLLVAASRPPYSLTPTQLIRLCLKISDKCRPLILKRQLAAVIEQEFQKIERFRKVENRNQAGGVQ